MTPRVKLLKLSSIVAFMYACSPQTEIIFNEGAPDPETGIVVNDVLICNPPQGLEWDLWGHFYPSFELPAHAVEGSMAEMYLFNGSCWRVEPKVTADTVVLRYADRYRKHSWAPKGFYIKMRESGKVIPVPAKWNFHPSDTLPLITYKKIALSLTDIVPSVKSVKLTGGESEVTKVEESLVEGIKPEGYRITISEGKALVEAADNQGLRYARLTLSRFKENAGSSVLPDMIVEDWPDFSYRAQMLDVSRVFYPVPYLKKVIDVLERCKVNTLTLHLNDDESWRIEIKDIPELTEFGAFHDVPVRQPDGSYKCVKATPPVKGSRLGKGIFEGTSGYYSEDDYCEILKYAAERGIKVIPEIDIPGHCNSAILAVRKYEERTRDSSFRLTDPEDKSVYRSVQGYSDNVIDIALPSTYHFIETVVDRILGMYKKTGLTLEEFAVGGDEVAPGVWLGSPACIEEMQKMGFSKIEELRSLFIQKVNGILKDRNLKICGYHEIAENLSEEATAEIKINCSRLWAWNTIDTGAAGIGYEFANAGFPIINANGCHTYLDNAYNMSASERGLVWAGTLDERKVFSLLPFNIAASTRFDSWNRPVDMSELAKEVPALERPENITGVQAMIWGDNLWRTEDALYMVYPKAYGLYERAWNAHPVWENTTDPLDPLFVDSFNHFYSVVVEREVSYLDRNGINHRPVMPCEN